MPASIDPRLMPVERELRYRESCLDRDLRVIRILIALAIVFHAASVPWDLTVMGTAGAAGPVWAVRAVFIAVSVAVLIRVSRPQSVLAFDRAVAVWATFLLGASLAATSFYPTEYANFVAWDVLLLVTLYAVVPLPFQHQFGMGSAFTLISVGILAWVKPVEAAGGLTDVILVFLCANLVGGFGAWELHRSRREQFVALVLSDDAKVRLEKALAEVRTLRGIIPICAACKLVRTEEGVWREVEAYVREHSEADFSHGICPTCEESFYRELDETTVET